MSFKWITKHNSPNYTPASKVSATWGRPRTIEKIAIHWWGDPNTKPTFDGVIATLCNPSRGASAHLVATGTNRQVACLVNLDDASWATNSANPYTISIECDPRCRPEDYDVVAELIAQIRSIYGNIGLVPHNKYVATACPGNYSLSKLDALAKKKSVSKSSDWGDVKNKTTTPPKPVSKAVPAAKKLPKVLKFKTKLNPTNVWDLTTNPNYKAATTLKKDAGFEAYASIAFNNATYYVTKYSYDKKLKVGVNSKDLVAVPVTPPKPPVVTPKPEPQPEPTPEAPESPSKVGLDESSTTLLQDVKRLLEELTTLIKSIFKTGDK